MTIQSFSPSPDEKAQTIRKSKEIAAIIEYL
jgi:hypothetical protein